MVQAGAAGRYVGKAPAGLNEKTPRSTVIRRPQAQHTTWHPLTIMVVRPSDETDPSRLWRPQAVQSTVTS